MGNGEKAIHQASALYTLYDLEVRDSLTTYASAP